ncbi:MAG: sterol desaturase family protein, partial [Bacteroidota bacterium]
MTEYSYLFPLVLNITKYFVLAGVPFFIFYIVFPETFSKNKIQSRNAKRKDFTREILHSTQATFVFVGLVLLI